MAAAPETKRRPLPLPPAELAVRVGRPAGETFACYEEIGRTARAEILGALPSGWSFEDKRVLDFGCGAGRVLRQFTEEAAVAKMIGCDIDGPSVDWLNANLSPPFAAIRNSEQPPLPWGDRSFDLILAISVFTHITDQWSAWLCELHRLLDRGGLLAATFLGAGMSESIAREPWVEDRIGMNALKPGLTWDQGGPCVLHSPWWIREHWGRAFEIEALEVSGFGEEDRRLGHGFVLLRKKDVPVSPALLEEPGTDPREFRALLHNVEQLQRESAELERMNEHSRQLLAQLQHSLSWRVTSPLRRLSRVLRSRTSSG